MKQSQQLAKSKPRNQITSLLVLVITFCLAGSCLGDPGKPLSGQLDKLIRNLEAGDGTEAKMALSAARQIKLSYSNMNPELIANVSGSIGRMNLGEYQAEIQKLTKQVADEISKKIATQKEKWAKQVDGYLQKVEQACIKDEPSDQLEALLAASDEIARLAPKTQRSSRGRPGDETTKFRAAISLLEQWIVFKRLEEKGYLRQAHDKLKNLASATPSFPILDKAFLDNKIAMAKDSMGEDLNRTAKGENLSKAQADVFKKLNNSKLNGKLLAEMADKLNALPYSHTFTTKYNDRLYLAIQALADCFHFMEIEDEVKAREKLSEFASESHAVPQLKQIRKKAIFQLTPILYAKIGAKAANDDQRLDAYIFDLIRKPKLIREATVHNDLLTFYRFITPNSTYYEAGKAHPWKKPARKQYSLLASAEAALKSEDYAFALKQFREAQEIAVLSGPANASELITVEIEKLRKLKPQLFDSSVAVMAAEIESYQSKIESLETKIEKLEKEVMDLKFRR